MSKFVILVLLCTFALSFSLPARAGYACDFWRNHPQQDLVLEGFVDRESAEYIEEVFACGVTINDINRLSLLVPAIDKSRLSVTEFLLSKGADLNSDIFRGTQFNLLKMAIYNIKTPNDGWLDVAEKIVRNDMSADQLQEALAKSIKVIPEQLPTLIDKILLAGANPNEIMSDCRTPLNVLSSWYDWAPFFFESSRHHRATPAELLLLKSNYEHVASSLLKAGANPNIDGYILFNFFNYWSDDQLKTILSYGANPNLLVSNWKMTVFERILTDADKYCLSREIGKIELLLQAGADRTVFLSRKFQCEKLENLQRKYKVQ